MSNADTSIETLPYRISSSRYFSIIFRKLFKKWWSVVLLSFVMMIAITCYELRFGIVLLMVIFLVVPLIVLLVYYNYALRPEAFYSVVEKTAIIGEDGIDCIYDEQYRKVLSWDKVTRVVLAKDAYHIYTGSHTYFYVPKDAFAEVDMLQKFEQLIFRKINS